MLFPRFDEARTIANVGSLSNVNICCVACSWEGVMSSRHLAMIFILFSALQVLASRMQPGYTRDSR